MLDGLTTEQRAQVEEHLRATAERLEEARSTRELTRLLCETDADFRKQMIEKLRRPGAEADSEFINTFCFTFDPRPNPFTGEAIGDVPFILDDEQEEFLRWYGELEEKPNQTQGDVVKSRDRGCTWIMIALRVKRWLFASNYLALMGHKTKDEIDKAGDTGSMFWKVKFLLKRLPEWLIEATCGPKWEDKEFNKLFLLSNPVNGNQIKGDPVTGATWGSGDRSTDAWLDEGPLAEGGQEAMANISYVAHKLWTTGTPPIEGEANWWSKRIIGSRGTPTVFELKWENDPRYNAFYLNENEERVYPWYEDKKSKQDVIYRARHLDRDFAGSVSGRVYPSYTAVREAQFDYDPAAPLYLSLDPGLDDRFGLVWWQPTHNGQWKILQQYHNRNRPATFYLPIILGPEYEDFFRGHGATEQDYHLMQRCASWQYTAFIGDPAGRNRSSSDGKSVYTLWAEITNKRTPYNSISYVHYDIKEGKDTMYRVHCLRMLLPKMIIERRYAKYIKDYLAACRYPEPSANAVKPVSKPIHDTLGRDTVTAMEYFAISRFANVTARSPLFVPPATAGMAHKIWGPESGLTEPLDEEELVELKEKKHRQRIPFMRRR